MTDWFLITAPHLELMELTQGHRVQLKFVSFFLIDE